MSSYIIHRTIQPYNIDLELKVIPQYPKEGMIFLELVCLNKNKAEIVTKIPSEKLLNFLKDVSRDIAHEENVHYRLGGHPHTITTTSEISLMSQYYR